MKNKPSPYVPNTIRPTMTRLGARFVPVHPVLTSEPLKIKFSA